jgi:sugar phosphate isomerase/epimerase
MRIIYTRFKYLRHLSENDSMKFGLSTIIYEPKFRELAKTAKDLENLYLTYIDLATKFALKCGFKIIEVSGLFNNPHEVLLPILKQIKDRIKVFDQITYHTPIRFISVKAMKECIMMGKKLGAKIIVLHPDFLPAPPNSLLPSQRFLRSKPEEMLELVSFCKKRGLIPCLENMPSEMPKYNRPEDFDFFVKKGAFLTVDTGHAATVNVDPVSFLDRFGKKVKHIHLQDGLVGMPDNHYALGDGDVDYVKFMNKLKEMKFKNLVILELVSENDVIKSLKRLNKFVKL